MSTCLTFFVAGMPAPGGSKNAWVPVHPRTKEPYRGKGGRIIVNVTDAGGEKTKLWRKAVAQAGTLAMKGEALLAGPVKADFCFFMPRPKDEFNSKGQLKEWAPRHHTKMPDALKLARSTEDALTGVVWVDDSQVVHGSQEKLYATMETGCRITISAYEDDEQTPLI